MRRWLIKSEPTAYSIDDLTRDGRTRWTGIRNYEARNFMVTGMRVGDLAIVYHSNAAPSGVAGLARVSAAAIPDPTQFDRADSHYEPRATIAKPVWFCVEVEAVAIAERFVPLAELRAARALAKMDLFKRSRLSITPLRPGEFKALAALAGLPEG